MCGDVVKSAGAAVSDVHRNLHTTRRSGHHILMIGLVQGQLASVAVLKLPARIDGSSKGCGGSDATAT
jgi:hypothetical protein